GTLTLSGANTYTGPTDIRDTGTVKLGANNALSASGTVAVGHDATFNLNGFSQTIGGLTGTGNVALHCGSLTVDTHSPTTFDGLFTGGSTSSRTKAGAGTLVLEGSSFSTYTGTTTVSAGTLALAAGGEITNSRLLTVNSGATFDISAIISGSAGVRTLAGGG